MKIDWQERTSIDPGVCHGKATIKGTDILAAIAYAAWLAREEEQHPIHTVTG